jgi:hypothetical protein
MFFRALPPLLILVILLLVSSCGKEKDGPVYRVIGEAYVGPNELPIRAELSLRSEVLATVKHDDKLEILDRRRRFVQVRTKSKTVGWVDSRQLISAKQRAQLEEMAQQHKQSPSMGQATVYDNLNVHTDPNRYSPTFYVIQEKDVVDVIGHRVVPKAPFAGPTLDIEEATPQVPVKKKRPRKEPAVPPPPAPAAPSLPENWLELSRPPVYTVEEADPTPKNGRKGMRKDTPSPAGGLAMDDLTLIRTKEGRVGWVLNNALFLQVPDEVAQYAEGNRITSYFAVGETKYEGGTKKHWLWTTQSQKYAPFDFDGLRVFTFNSRRGRYETAYRERGLRGFFPLTVSSSEAEAEFHVLTEEAPGRMLRKSYVFNGTRVSSKGKQPYQAPDQRVGEGPKPVNVQAPEPGLWERLKKMLPGKR